MNHLMCIKLDLSSNTKKIHNLELSLDDIEDMQLTLEKL